MQEQIYCHVDGCERIAMYKGEALCQKHYFRRMRNGHYGLNSNPMAPGERKMAHSNGYIMLRYPGHPLAQKHGGLFEHRYVMYQKYGDNLPPCEFCGKESRWHSRDTHIDHIDCDKTNNDIGNLRVLCNPCNVSRSKKPPHTHKHTTSITIDGKTMTSTEWARIPGVLVSSNCIRDRIRRGFSARDAVYGEKKTHNGRRRLSKRHCTP